MDTSSLVVSADLEAALAGDAPLIPPVEDADALLTREGEGGDAPEATPSEIEPTQTAPEPESKPEPEDFEARYKSDAEFKRFVDARANALKQRERDREAKAQRKARLTEAVQDPVKALADAQAELEALEAEESQATRAASRVQADLEALATDEDDGPFYAALYRQEGAESLNARLRDDPTAAFRWIKKEVRRLAVEAAAKEASAPLAEAMATHKTNQQLAALPVPPSAAAAALTSDKEFIRLYSTGKSDDHARASKLLGL